MTSVVGQPVLALAQRPELTTGLRFNSGGHRTALAARLRDPGPPVALAGDRYVYGFGCKPEGCREGGVFLAYDVHDLMIYNEKARKIGKPELTYGYWAEKGKPATP